jgi:hypothetical protein
LGNGAEASLPVAGPTAYRPNQKARGGFSGAGLNLATMNFAGDLPDMSNDLMPGLQRAGTG